MGIADDFALIRNRLDVLEALVRYDQRDGRTHPRVMDMELIAIEHDIAVLRTKLGLPGGTALIERFE